MRTESSCTAVAVLLAAAILLVGAVPPVGAQYSRLELAVANSAGNGGFGSPVSVSGNTALIGPAYVFVQSGDTWVQQTRLAADDMVPGGLSGRSLAISEDTLVVGARQSLPISVASKSADGATTRGAAYVFTRTGGVWTQQAKLTAEDATPYSEFASSVALSGDTVVVAASRDSEAAASAGAVYVFARAAGVWGQPVKIVDPGATAGQNFGYSIALSSDTLVVGTPEENNRSGSVYVFTRPGGVWTQQAKLVSTSFYRSESDFGRCVAISGDVVVVGADTEWANGIGEAGAAYVFTRSGGVWTQEAQLVAGSRGNLSYFGGTVAISGDTAIVGAWGARPSGVISGGAAYLFRRSGGTWTQSEEFTAPNPEENDRFATSVAISGETAVVARGRRDAAYVFMPSGGTGAGRPGNTLTLY